MRAVENVSPGLHRARAWCRFPQTPVVECASTQRAAAKALPRQGAISRSLAHPATTENSLHQTTYQPGSKSPKTRRREFVAETARVGASSRCRSPCPFSSCLIGHHSAILALFTLRHWQFRALCAIVSGEGIVTASSLLLSEHAQRQAWAASLARSHNPARPVQTSAVSRSVLPSRHVIVVQSFFAQCF